MSYYDRIIQLGEDLRSHVFGVLDGEPEMTGMEAGAIAKAVEHAFITMCQEYQQDKP